MSAPADPFGLAALPDPLPIEPMVGELDAVVHLPGSKSITNRALVCAALATGTSVLTGALLSDDTEAMTAIVEALGLGIEVSPSAADGPAITVTGCGGSLPGTDQVLTTRQSGTTSRFVLPMLALGTGGYEVTAHEQMQLRPMGTTFESLELLGATIEPRGEPGHLPVRLVAGTSTVAGELRVPGDVSSQFLSGLLLSAPCLPHGLRLTVVGDLVSRPYVDLTIAVMAAFGAQVSEPEPNTFVVAATGYRATQYAVEPDASAASYPLAAVALCGGSVQIQGLHLGSLQGDVRFADALEQLGLSVDSDGDPLNRLTATCHLDEPLRGGTFDFTHISDTAQTLAVLAPFADAPVTITGIGFIRRKEIDRVAAVTTELRRCGVRVDEDADGWTIHPGPVAPTVIETYDDHRMAMSFALLGLRTPGMAIAGPACVAKTFPGYWAMLQAMRVPGSGR